MPLRPLRILQRWPQEKQRNALFSSFSYNSPSTVRVERTSPRVAADMNHETSGKAEEFFHSIRARNYDIKTEREHNAGDCVDQVVPAGDERPKKNRDNEDREDDLAPRPQPAHPEK